MAGGGGGEPGPAAPQIQSELCAVCPRGVGGRAPRLSAVPQDQMPEGPVTGSRLSMARQESESGDQDNGEAEGADLRSFLT